MKKYYTLFIFAYCSTFFGQVGVNTTNPQEELHVGGSNSTIRVEGLNTPNNINNLGTASSTPVYVDADGDLVLGTLADNVEILFDSENYLVDVQDPTSLINQVGSGAGFSQGGIPIGGTAISFTLTKPAIVEVNYSVTWNVGKNVTAT